ncbi:MAG TPA: hypothetical protein VFL27_15780, partial [Candidatus Dormibacteraeota bacterium]|nr:hypothetical protein [Candidatus Dormibacteraeota bacterium]
MRRWLNWRSALIGGALGAALVVVFSLGASAGIGNGSLAAPTGSDSQTGQQLNPTHWKVQAGDTITDTIVGADDAVPGGGPCASTEVLVTIQSGSFGNQQLCGTLSGGTITFTWTVQSQFGVCGTTIVSYNATGNLANNGLLKSGGHSAAGLAIVDAQGDVIQTCIPESNARALTVSKAAAGAYTKTWTWTIVKSVDHDRINTSASTATFNYTVSVHHDEGTISNVKVTGTISITNPNADAVNIDVINDKLSTGDACTVTDGGPQSIASGVTTFAYECDLSSVPAGDVSNTVTISWP